MSQDSYLKELQLLCVKDSGEQTSSLQASLINLLADPLATLDDLMKPVHNLKGNVQAVGFAHCGAFLHDLENAYRAVTAELSLAGPKIDGSDLMMLEFMLSDSVQAVEGYFHELHSHGEDREEFAKSRRPSINLLNEWKSTKPAANSINAAAESIPTPVVPPEATPAIVTPAVLETHVEAVVEKAPVPLVTPVAAPPLPSAGFYLLLKNGAAHLAVPIEQVREIVQYRGWTEVPGNNPNVLGVLDLRDKVVPILNLNYLMGTPGQPGNRYIVICHWQGATFGFPVESADRVMELKSDSFQVAGAGISGCFSLTNGQMIQVIDLAGAMAA